MKKFLFQAYYTAIVEAVSYVSQCALKKDTRPILESVNIKVAKGEDTARVTATDSAIAVTSRVDLVAPYNDDDLSFNVEPKTFANAMSLLGLREDCEKKLLRGLLVDFNFDDETRKLYASTSKIEVEIPLIDGDYPLIKNVFEDTARQCDKKLCLSIEELSNIVNTAKKAHCARVQFELRADNDCKKPFHATLDNGAGEFVVTACRPLDD